MEIRISLTQLQREALELFINCPRYRGRWAVVEDCIKESIGNLIRMAMAETPPTSLIEKRQQIQQLEEELESHTSVSDVTIVETDE